MVQEKETIEVDKGGGEGEGIDGSGVWFGHDNGFGDEIHIESVGRDDVGNGSGNGGSNSDLGDREIDQGSGFDVDFGVCGVNGAQGGGEEVGVEMVLKVEVNVEEVTMEGRIMIVV